MSTEELARQAQLMARGFFFAIALGILGLGMTRSKRLRVAGVLLLLLAIVAGCSALAKFDELTMVP